MTRLVPLALAVLPLLAACYDDGSPPRRQVEQGCQAMTCESAGAQCGEVPDGCGGVLECGECPAGETCGGGGPNACGPGACQPISCAQAGATCGPLGDGCGAVIDCGPCAPGEACGAGGVANACAPAPCTPSSCDALGAACGEVGDGCGGTLACGDCPAGETCGGGGAANTCGAAPCTPATCEALGAACGAVADGCGAMLDCGGCPEGETCGGGGAANQCGAPACEPESCASLEAACGTAHDGCGGTLECGACPGGDACEDNRCVPPPPPPGTSAGATRWVHPSGGRGDEHVGGVGVAGDGTVVALTVLGGTIGNPEALGLVRLDGTDGAELAAEVILEVRGHLSLGPDPLAVTPDGGLLLAFDAWCEAEGCTTIGGAPVERAALVKLGTDGRGWWKALPNGVASNVEAMPGGGALVARGFADAGMDPVTVLRLEGGGAERWAWVGSGEARTAVGAGPGGVALVAQAQRVTALDDASGAVRWQTELAGDAFLTAVVATPGGAVLAAGSFGDAVSLGGEEVRGAGDAARSAFLAALDGATGAPRWLRAAGPAVAVRPGDVGADVDLAAGDAEWAALLVREPGCAFRLERWSAEGTRAWTRALGAEGCPEAGVFPAAIAVGPAGDVVAGGGFSVPVDLGKGVETGDGGRDGFVVELAP